MKCDESKGILRNLKKCEELEEKKLGRSMKK
jgi:hypothetical protein